MPTTETDRVLTQERVEQAPSRQSADCLSRLSAPACLCSLGQVRLGLASRFLWAPVAGCRIEAKGLVVTDERRRAWTSASGGNALIRTRCWTSCELGG
jgi:hypothetical protein